MDAESREPQAETDPFPEPPPPQLSRGDSIVGVLVLAVALCVLGVMAMSPAIEQYYPQYFPWRGAVLDSLSLVGHVLVLGVIAAGAIKQFLASTSRNDRLTAAALAACAVGVGIWLVGVLAGFV